LVLLGLAGAPFALSVLFFPEGVSMRFAKLTKVRMGESVDFIVPRILKDRREAEDSIESIDPPIGEKIHGGRPWKCLKCGEVNPANFEACWKCSSDETTVA
jgi:hypothetical protein